MEARRYGDQPWTTDVGERNKPAAQAEEELRVLRAWVSGQTLPARIYGEIVYAPESTYLSRVRVEVRGEGHVFSTTTDSSGHFAFENLAPGVYKAVARLPRVSGPIKINLTHAWCWHAVFVAD